MILDSRARGYMCFRHKTESAAAICGNCKKPVCAKCIVRGVTTKQLYCSTECIEEDERHRKNVSAAASAAKRKKILLTVLKYAVPAALAIGLAILIIKVLSK